MNNSNSLTLEKLKQSVARFESLHIAVGFTVNPKTYYKLRNMSESKYMCEPDYIGARIYNVPNQAEDCLIFYSEEALQNYLLLMEPESKRTKEKEGNQCSQSK